MIVYLEEGWNDSGSHDSKYSGPEMQTLVLKVANLPGITNLGALPAGIKAFSQSCISGDTPVWITKGLHQRWDKIRADGVVTKAADPHIQFKFNYAWSSGSRWVTGHFFLSETFAFTENYHDGDWDRYGWDLVGLGITWSGMHQRFPGHFRAVRQQHSRSAIGQARPQAAQQRRLDRGTAVRLTPARRKIRPCRKRGPIGWACRFPYGRPTACRNPAFPRS